MCQYETFLFKVHVVFTNITVPSMIELIKFFFIFFPYLIFSLVVNTVSMPDLEALCNGLGADGYPVLAGSREHGYNTQHLMSTF